METELGTGGPLTPGVPEIGTPAPQSPPVVANKDADKAAAVTAIQAVINECNKQRELLASHTGNSWPAKIRSELGGFTVTRLGRILADINRS